MTARISLKITDGERNTLAQWSNLSPVEMPNGTQEMTFTGPDGAPWYAEIKWDSSDGGITAEGAPQHIEGYSDYELTSEVYRRITGGADLVEHEPYMENDE